MSTDKQKFLYNSQLDAFTLYHLVNESNHRSSIDGGPALPALGHALAGSIGAAAAKALVYPLDLVVTRLQVQRQLRGSNETPSAARDADAEYTGVIDAARKIYANEGGVAAFFTGCSSDVGKGLIDSFLFFLAYSWIRNRELRKRNAKTLSVPVELAVGVAAGSFSKFFTTPIQNIVTRQQTASMKAARVPDGEDAGGDGLSVTRIAKSIYRERGIMGFWAGYNASVILTANPSITFAADNLLRRLLPRAKRENPGPYLIFLIAAVSKVVATSITYPVQLAKSRAQAGGGGKDVGDEPLAGSAETLVEKPGLNATPARPTSTPTLRDRLRTVVGAGSGSYAIYLSLQKICREEGVAGIYSGLEGDLLKSFVSHGLTMMLKEKVHTGVIQLYYVLLKLMRRWPNELQKAKDKAQSSVAQARNVVADGTQRLVADAKQAVSGRGN